MSYVMKSKRKYKKALRRIRSSGSKCKENNAHSALHRPMGPRQCRKAVPVRPAGPDWETLTVERGLVTPGEIRMKEGLTLDGMSTHRG